MSHLTAKLQNIPLTPISCFQPPPLTPLLSAQCRICAEDERLHGPHKHNHTDNGPFERGTATLHSMNCLKEHEKSKYHQESMARRVKRDRAMDKVDGLKQGNMRRSIYMNGLEF